MYQFDFVFKIHNFDQHGEEHRLRFSQHSINDERALESGAKGLVQYVARLLRCEADDFAAKRIILKSAWLINVRNKKRRITAKELLEAMLRAGISTKGRKEQRIDKPPEPVFGSGGRRNRHRRPARGG